MAITQLVEHQISDRKIGDSRFDSLIGMRRFAFEKDIFHKYFALGSSSLPAADQVEKLANRIQKRVLYVGVIIQTQIGWFTRMNKWLQLLVIVQCA